MTDYKFHSNSRKRRKAASKWQGILAVVVTCILIFVIALGFLKGIRLKGGFGKSVWDGSSPVAIALNTNPDSVLVFQKDTKKVVFLVIPSDVGYATGYATEPVKNVSSSIREGSEGGKDFLTKYLGAKVTGFVQFKEEKKMDKTGAEQIFKDFAFLTTPMFIIFNGLSGEVEETNLSRIDMLKLWWKVKGISIASLEYFDLDKYTVEIIESDGQTFKGLDRDVFRKTFASYFEDFRVIGKHIELDIVNATGESGMGMLASDLAEISGYDVIKVSSDESLLEKTKIVITGDKGDVSYLAKLFNCDIYRQENEAESPRITLYLGRDFAKVYN